MKAPIVTDGVCLELVPFLHRVVLERAATHPGNGSNNVGGWKSAEDFLTWPGDEIQRLHFELAAHLELAGARGTLLAWAMVNRNGSHHKRHTHGRQYMVGVYFVAAGDPATPLMLELGSGAEIAVDPVPGRLVIFPGGMFHRVPLYGGTEPRISIAFEARP